MAIRTNVYKSDEALQEIHDEMYRMEEERPQSNLSEFDQRTKFFIGLACAGLIWLLYTQRIEFKEALIFGIAGFIVLFIMKGTDSRRKELTWIECMIRVNDLLKFLQAHKIGDRPQIPKGELEITPLGRKQWYEGRAFKRSYGVKIYDKDTNVEDWYFVEVDIYTGDIITFKSTPEGVTGDETKDIKILPSFDMVMTRKRESYLGKR